jgi:ABC-type sulfate transport system permease component
MSEYFRPRRVCALFVAYVVALQALLLPLSALAATSFGNSICAVASADNSKRSGNACGAVCGVACCAPALDVPADVIVAVLLRDARLFSVALAFATPVRSTPKGPQIPRAPPA